MDERENCKRCCALATSRVVATADVLVTSEHQPPRFSGCLQCARIDCQNRHRRSGRHEEHKHSKRLSWITTTLERPLSPSPASKPTPALGIRVQVMLTSVTPPTIELIPRNSTALMRATYRGTSMSLNGSDAMKLRYADRSCRRCLRSALVDFRSTPIAARPY